RCPHHPQLHSFPYTTLFRSVCRGAFGPFTGSIAGLTAGVPLPPPFEFDWPPLMVGLTPPPCPVASVTMPGGINGRSSGVALFPKIGRASCRERVGGWVRGGA